MDPEQREIDASLPTQAVEITPPTEQPDLNPDTVTPQELADPITRRRFLDVLKDAAYPFFIGGNLSNSFPQGKLFRGAIENMLHTGEPAIPCLLYTSRCV